MILAQIKTPFMCDQEAVLTSSLLDSAAGHKSIFLSSAYRWIFLNKVDYIQILRKQLPRRISILPGTNLDFTLSLIYKGYLLLLWQGLVRCAALHYQARRVIVTAQALTPSIQPINHVSQNTQWKKAVFYPLPHCFYSEWAENRWGFVRPSRQSQCSPDCKLLAMVTDPLQGQMMVALWWHSLLLTTSPGLQFPLSKAGPGTGTKIWILLSGYPVGLLAKWLKNLTWKKKICQSSVDFCEVRINWASISFLRTLWRK